MGHEDKIIVVPWDFHQIRPDTTGELRLFDRVWVEFEGKLNFKRCEITDIQNDRYITHCDDGKVDRNVIGAYILLIHRARASTKGDHITWMTQQEIIELV